MRAPRAVMLFGPPGTGKTTFARAIASRLGWPFVALFPSRLAGSANGLAGGLSEAFVAIARMEHVLVFIDEVEEIVASRKEGSAPVGVVNELVKSSVSFREQPQRLLVCATNSISGLDGAFLRHGRFDYVLPIGPPDAQARTALWRHAAGASGAVDVDPGVLVAASEGLTRPISATPPNWSPSPRSSPAWTPRAGCGRTRRPISPRSSRPAPPSGRATWRTSRTTSNVSSGPEAPVRAPTEVPQLHLHAVPSCDARSARAENSATGNSRMGSPPRCSAQGE